MKLKNIFSIALFLVATVACSMEDNDVMNDITKGSSNTEMEYASFSFNIDVKSGVESKSGSSLANDTVIPADKVINNVSLILLDNSNNVLQIINNATVGAEDYAVKSGSKVNMQVKVERGTTPTFKLMAIANSSESFIGCTTLSAVQAKVQDAADLATLVKIGEATAQVTTTYPTLATAVASPVTFNVPLKQLAARIELDAFNVTFKSGTKPVAVTIKEVKLLNVNTETQTVFDSNSKGALTNPVIGTNLSAADFTKVAGYTFPNHNGTSDVNDNALQMQLTIDYDGCTVEGGLVKTFVINRPDAADFSNSTEQKYIHSGYVYRVTVNASLTSNNIEFEATCCVNDWAYNRFEQIMEEMD